MPNGDEPTIVLYEGTTLRTTAEVRGADMVSISQQILSHTDGSIVTNDNVTLSISDLNKLTTFLRQEGFRLVV